MLFEPEPHPVSTVIGLGLGADPAIEEPWGCLLPILDSEGHKAQAAVSSFKLDGHRRAVSKRAQRATFTMTVRSPTRSR